ncbi:GNAT family N-acetyltransferase [Sporosarcina sp. D27]|uniref:GNAT family N-acetyltransferase n=1 Tax=Sporosarcina sp. D27 TaxID=1382305 RepID=UPI0004717B31|nr:GNAT family N-acetyltransferase [Sporosarcina sp. D27]
MTGFLVGKRLTLREMEDRDWMDVHRYASQPSVCQYQPWGPNTEEESQLFVQQVMADAAVNPRSRFVFAVTENDVLIGAGELNIRSFTNREGEIGYIIHPDYWGEGYATEVATLLINFGFENLSLHRIFATCDPRNVGSSTVLGKVGMTHEGRIRENLLLEEGWRDSFLYSVLDSEWRKKRGGIRCRKRLKFLYLELFICLNMMT